MTYLHTRLAVSRVFIASIMTRSRKDLPVPALPVMKHDCRPSTTASYTSRWSAPRSARDGGTGFPGGVASLSSSERGGRDGTRERAMEGGRSREQVGESGEGGSERGMERVSE